MPPTRFPFPRFIADSAQEKAPYGHWEERLIAEFSAACEPLAAEAGAPFDPEEVRWFPERGWGGRVYLPVSSHTETPEGDPIEYFGYVSFVRPAGGEPEDLTAKADFTDVSAEDNPDWKIDLNDEVIGHWKGDAGRGGDVTLVWGLPLVRGAVAASTEVNGEGTDQMAIVEGRFTLVSVDAVKGFGDEFYVEVKLWDRKLREIAGESLYEDDDEPEPEGEEDEEPEASSS